MNLYESAYKYFCELSRIPRMPLHEAKVRNWIIHWAEQRGWNCQIDDIGNLLVIAPGEEDTYLCLQGHMDMVCVSDGNHDFASQGVAIMEKEGRITGKKTSLGADNGIGVATMMAVADIHKRPTLELLFTMGEEVGLVGAQYSTLPLKAKKALNLDWCHSDTIGVGCGGTLLMQGDHMIDTKKYPLESRDDTYVIKIHGMKGGHSGEDIRHYRGNALIELFTVIKELTGITHVGTLSGGEADNAIPHSAEAIVAYNGHPNLLANELSHIQKKLRQKYKHDTITLVSILTNKSNQVLKKEYILPILEDYLEVGTGVQVWGKQNTPLSSWNLGIFSLNNGGIQSSYFLRTNIENGIDTMQQTILTKLHYFTWTLSHVSPPWHSHESGDFIECIQKFWVDEDGNRLPLVTTHAAVECGILAKKYPDTQWVSVGATVHDMHTTRESIEIKDFERFVARIEELIAGIE